MKKRSHKIIKSRLKGLQEGGLEENVKEGEGEKVTQVAKHSSSYEMEE